MHLASRVPPPSRRTPNWGSEEAHTWKHHPRPIIPPPRLNREAESRRRQLIGCISRGRARPYTRRKDPPHSYPETNFRREGARDMYRKETKPSSSKNRLNTTTDSRLLGDLKHTTVPRHSLAIRGFFVYLSFFDRRVDRSYNL